LFSCFADAEGHPLNIGIRGKRITTSRNLQLKIKRHTSAGIKFMSAISETFRRLSIRLALVLLAGACAIPQHAVSQTCDSGPDLDAATKSAIETTAQRYFNMSAQGDVAGLKASSIPALADNFSGIEQAVVDNEKYFSEGQPDITGTYLLDASQSKGTLQRADFYCGIYNSGNRVGFSIPNLPAGKYAIVIQKVTGGKNPVTLSMILQDLGGSWKLAGYYPRLNAIGGHDGQWYLTKAREYNAKNQLHNAWFYYLTAWDLIAPVDFMGNVQLDKLAEEMQSARPSDLPSSDTPMDLSANGKVFKVTELAPVPVGSDLNLRVRYQTIDASNNAVASQDNMAVIKAIVAKYPELRDAFNAVIARAVDSSGHEYGSLLAMKDVK
jgi:hypothetical protein